MTRRTKPSGFTLIELLVVITIIGILTAAGIVFFSVAQKKARDTRRKQDVEAISHALEQYFQDNSYSYGTFSDCSNLVPTYTAQLPLDPTTQTTYSCTRANTTYCITAKMEDPKAGNCSSCTPGAGTTDYCLINTQ